MTSTRERIAILTGRSRYILNHLAADSEPAGPNAIWHQRLLIAL